MQLDTEDGETFVPPAGVVASPTMEQPQQSTNGRAGAQQQEEEEGGGAQGEAEQDAAV
jgi:sorting nexin-1/2